MSTRSANIRFEPLGATIVLLCKEYLTLKVDMYYLNNNLTLLPSAKACRTGEPFKIRLPRKFKKSVHFQLSDVFKALSVLVRDFSYVRIILGITSFLFKLEWSNLRLISQVVVRNSGFKVRLFPNEIFCCLVLLGFTRFLAAG